jgi:predicted acylesterase/phospholipase RssA
MGEPSSTSPGDETGGPPDRASRRFQVLVLDGGGYRGMFSAAALAILEDDLQVRLADYFDLIVGTSTGGIVALGLGADKTPRELVEFYLRDAAIIFSHPWSRMIRQTVRPKYSAERLRCALGAAFGDKRLEQSSKRLCIPSYDLLSDQVYLFRTPHHPDLVRDGRTPMVDVALATSAAPTYFPSHNLGGLRLVDGGVWANTPVPTAINEAINRFDIKLQDLRILSVGTTSALRDWPCRLDRAGLFGWSRHATDLLLRAQAVAATNTMKLLLRADHSLRVDPIVPKRLRRLDRVDPDSFMGLAAGITRQMVPDVERVFLDHEPEPYTPCIKSPRST